MTPEELEEQRRKRQASKVAQSQASATPIQAAAPLQAPAPGQSQSPLAQVGGQVGQKLLKTALGGMFGGLFNNGGMIPQGYNKGGWLTSIFGSGKPRTSRTFGEASKPARTQTTGWTNPLGKNPYRQKVDNLNAAAQKRGAQKNIWGLPGFNTGGSVGNPNGYNEGGSTMGTPIKKVMDIEKLDSQKKMDALKEDQAERTWYMAEKRKDEAHAQAMKQKEESHQMAMKLKKESATMKAPLSKGD